jgi:hypothetical protein
VVHQVVDLHTALDGHVGVLGYQLPYDGLDDDLEFGAWVHS